ncbi:L-lysine exporter family protein LysE/ArgO [Palleronia marisminoris]|uniref:Arginine exporter protein ArgO n=1 Tax=Palleronia marisminoris TaxID=315423 RepID=A0A1Y5REW6_9RHOB|nr:LysE/ArgO family amino acid transporter [Palleronia marisminoris]SFG16087.1 L-lysine exporter family protein LysE/ArgO [Palleronia marisminoris]SLN15845.1 Arginine exporter protein ArgO [Palleronia marisminoris]
MTSLLSGFALGFSLILAIGAQNAFVLRQGLRRAHVLPVVLTCAVSDAALITAGVAGFGWLVEAAPWIAPVFTFGGAAFLIAYGTISLRSAWRGGQALEAADERAGDLSRAVATCLALTWLNPHVYLDTVVLLGSISSQSPWPFGFGVGAVTASFVFFFALGYGARLLSPLFAKPSAWRWLDVIVGLTMLALALKLVAS